MYLRTAGDTLSEGLGLGLSGNNIGGEGLAERFAHFRAYDACSKDLTSRFIIIRHAIGTISYAINADCIRALSSA